MRKTITTLVALLALALTTGAEGGCGSSRAGPKDCFSDTGSDKPVFIDMVWSGGDPPWTAMGYARDSATGNHVEINEPITTNRSFTRKLMYISGCRVHVWMQVKNGKQGFAFVRADDGPGSGCRAEDPFVSSIACEFTTKR